MKSDVKSVDPKAKWREITEKKEKWRVIYFTGWSQSKKSKKEIYSIFNC